MNKELKHLLVEKNMSQRVLAHKTAIPENRLSSIVNGWVTPKDFEQTKLANALNVPINQLFGEVEVCLNN